MKKLILSFLDIFSRMLWMIINSDRVNRLQYIKNVFYTNWIKHSFKKFGNRSYIKSPMYIKGVKYITVGDNFCADFRLRIEAFDTFHEFVYHPQIIIGNNVIFN